MGILKGTIKAIILGIKLSNPKTRKALIKKQMNKLEKRVMA